MFSMGLLARIPIISPGMSVYVGGLGGNERKFVIAGRKGSQIDSNLPEKVESATSKD